MIKIIHKTLIVFIFLITNCAKEKKQEPSNNSSIDLKKPSALLTEKQKNRFQVSKINNVCDCYSYSVDIYNKAISIRMSYDNFEDFGKNQASVNRVKQLTANWRKIRQHCLMTYQRAMFEPNDCKYPPDSVEKLKNKFYSLGFSPSY